MQIADQCDEIGTTLLLSDADSALAIVQIALSRPPGERRAMATQHAKIAYRRICELVLCVQMEGNALQNLGTKLEAIRVALDEAEREDRTGSSMKALDDRVTGEVPGAG
jgi:hypothetical protein